MSELPNTLTLSREATLAVDRSQVYSFLARAFFYPREVLLDYLTQAQSSLVSLGQPELASSLETVKPIAQSVEALRTEYLRAFGHTVNPDFPPYETEYGNTNLYQLSAGLGDIAAFYRSFGLEAGAEERLDHIGVELEFMYFLTFKEAYAWQHHGAEKAGLCRDMQKKFMESHLGRWSPLFLSLLHRKSPGQFYGELSRIGQDFLASEMELLEAQPQVLAESDFNPGAMDWKSQPGWEAKGCSDDCV